MCTFVTTGKWRVKRVVARFVAVRCPCEAQIKAAEELAAMKKFSVARGGMDKYGPFRRPLWQRDAKYFGTLRSSDPETSSSPRTMLNLFNAKPGTRMASARGPCCLREPSLRDLPHLLDM